MFRLAAIYTWAPAFKETPAFPLVMLKYLDHYTPQRFCMRACRLSGSLPSLFIGYVRLVKLSCVRPGNLKLLFLTTICIFK